MNGGTDQMFRSRSRLDALAALAPNERRRVLAAEAKEYGITVAALKARYVHSWQFTARPKQLPPAGDWTFWLLMAGRGFGKTLSGAQWAAQRGREERRRIAVVAPTLGDARATCFEGETGLLSVLPPQALLGQSAGVAWNKSLLELTLANGTIFKGFSSEEPDRLRGPQHHYVWCEEVSSWKDARLGDAMGTTWSNLKLGLRLGDHPRAVLTSTPKANKLTKHLVSLADSGTLALVRGSSYENRENLPEAWWRTVVAPLEGTRTGRQEIEAELLEDLEGALWTRSMIDASRVKFLPGTNMLAFEGWQKDPALRETVGAQMARIVVGVDPNTTSGESADSAGVVVCGLAPDGEGYVLDDRTVIKGGPAVWRAVACDAYHGWMADKVAVEVNNGGEMCRLVLHGFDSSVTVEDVRASRGKQTRAEPVAALYVTDEPHSKFASVHHVGVFPHLEDELTSWVPGADESPGRLDALVWAMTKLRIWRPATDQGAYADMGDIEGITEMGAGLLDAY